MDRRDFMLAMPVLLAGCGAPTENEMAEYQIQSSPVRTAHLVDTKIGSEVFQEGSWTPDVTFITPGDLSVAYSVQSGTYILIGKLVFITFTITTSTFTHSTASNAMWINGLPFKCSPSYSSRVFVGTTAFAGFTFAGYTQMNASVPTNTTRITLAASGSGQTGLQAVAASHTTSGVNIVLQGQLFYVPEN